MRHTRGPGARRAGTLALRGLATLAVAVIGTGGVAAAAPGGDPGPPEQAQGNGPPATPPASQRAPAPTPQGKAKGQAKAAPATPVDSGRGQARGHAKSGGGSGGSAGSTGQGHVKPHGNTGGPSQQGSSHAQAGKVTLCHATGSATNPYVEITISANALAAHQRHRDGRDIYPASAGGCPGGSAAGGHQNEHAKVTICHATGSETNPYVRITVDTHALEAHTSHQDGDYIVNPTGPCPGVTIPAGVGNPPSGIVSGGGLPPAGGQLPEAGQPAAEDQPASGVLGVSEEGGGGSGGAPEDEGAVLGANQGGGEAGEAGESSGTSLPFTGLELLLMAAAGLVLGLAGWRLRRSAA
jgi:hypothetical protein